MVRRMKDVFAVYVPVLGVQFVEQSPVLFYLLTLYCVLIHSKVPSQDKRGSGWGVEGCRRKGKVM